MIDKTYNNASKASFEERPAIYQALNFMIDNLEDVLSRKNPAKLVAWIADYSLTAEPVGGHGTASHQDRIKKLFGAHDFKKGFFSRLQADITRPMYGKNAEQCAKIIATQFLHFSHTPDYFSAAQNAYNYFHGTKEQKFEPKL